MPNLSSNTYLRIAVALILASVLFFAHRRSDANAVPPAAASTSEPWTDAQIVQPADLARELAAAKGNDRPVVVCAGSRVLYEGAHVPGAVFHGPASSPEALADLKKWAAAMPRSANIVIYCGCCPLDRCPNIRPAFAALQSLGFQHLQMLLLPHNFVTDWVNQGYPIAKGR